MRCEKCLGVGWITVNARLNGNIVVFDRAACPNVLCHNGQVACCDGLQEQPDDSCIIGSFELHSPKQP